MMVVGRGKHASWGSVTFNPKAFGSSDFSLCVVGMSQNQEGDWMSIPAYFEKHAPDHIKAKRKTLAAKKAWITKETSTH